MSEVISCEIGTLELAELNNEDARKIDTAIGIIISDMPGKLAVIKNILNELKSEIESLETRDISYDLDSNVETLVEGYDTYAKDVLAMAQSYEINILTAISILDAENSLNGESSLDYSFFKSLPFLGTLFFTAMGYMGNDNKLDDFPQFALDVSGQIQDSDFDTSMKNLIYNSVEGLGEKYLSLNYTRANAAAALILSAVETISGLNNMTDPRQLDGIIINSIGDGAKYLAGNMIAQYAAIPTAKAVVSYLTGAGMGSTGSTIIGGLAGSGVAFVGGLMVYPLIDLAVNELTGDALIPGTSIPKNGGINQLYSNHIKSIESNCDRTTTYNGLTISKEYSKALAQQDPFNAMMGLEDYKDNLEMYPLDRQRLERYIERLNAIPKDSPDLEHEVKMAMTDEYYTNIVVIDQVSNLLGELDFDPVQYVLNR